MDFDIIKQAGLTQEEFGKLVGDVGRSTVSLWVCGRFRPNRFIAPRVQEVLDTLTSAVVRGVLPVQLNTGESPHMVVARRELQAVQQAKNPTQLSPVFPAAPANE